MRCVSFLDNPHPHRSPKTLQGQKMNQVCSGEITEASVSSTQYRKPWHVDLILYIFCVGYIVEAIIAPWLHVYLLYNLEETLVTLWCALHLCLLALHSWVSMRIYRTTSNPGVLCWRQTMSERVKFSWCVFNANDDLSLFVTWPASLW
jgi:hypothetical protein